MARAKRTDRAEARRRGRATLAAPLVEIDDEAGTDPESSVARGGRPAGRARGGAGVGATAAAPQRPSVASAFRSSFRPVHWREDIRALPSLVTHWSFYVPVILCGLALLVSQYFPKDPLAATFSAYFSGVTPLGSVFIAGLFARRASWLVGGLVSIAAAVLLALSLFVRYAGLPDGVFVDVGIGQVSLVSSEQIKTTLPSVIFETLTVGAVTGALFASAGAWYRRFLNRANPNRSRPSTPTSRRPDGKIPRKQAQRPMLARRR